MFRMATPPGRGQPHSAWPRLRGGVSHVPRGSASRGPRRTRALALVGDGRSRDAAGQRLRRRDPEPGGLGSRARAAPGGRRGRAAGAGRVRETGDVRRAVPGAAGRGGVREGERGLGGESRASQRPAAPRSFADALFCTVVFQHFLCYVCKEYVEDLAQIPKSVLRVSVPSEQQWEDLRVGVPSSVLQGRDH